MSCNIYLHSIFHQPFLIKCSIHIFHINKFLNFFQFKFLLFCEFWTHLTNSIALLSNNASTMISFYISILSNPIFTITSLNTSSSPTVFLTFTNFFFFNLSSKLSFYLFLSSLHFLLLYSLPYFSVPQTCLKIAVLQSSFAPLLYNFLLYILIYCNQNIFSLTLLFLYFPVFISLILYVFSTSFQFFLLLFFLLFQFSFSLLLLLFFFFYNFYSISLFFCITIEYILVDILTLWEFLPDFPIHSLLKLLH